MGGSTNTVRTHAEARPGRVAAAGVEARLAAMLDERAERDHELCSALLAVEAAGRVLADRLRRRDDRDDADLAVALHAEAFRLRRLVAGTPEGAPVSFDVRRALRPVVATHRAAGQRIAVAIPPGQAALGRPDVLAEVVGNLLANATCHAPGARVTLGTARAVQPGTIRLVVADDGPGFPSAAFARATERGWRGNPSAAPGHGLGLFVSSRLMQRDGGALSLLRPPPGTHGAVVALDLRDRSGVLESPLEGLAGAS